MKRISLILIILTVLGLVGLLHAQMAGLRGDATEHRNGLHDGNLFVTTFYNDGTYGQITNPPDIPGEWPSGSGHIYLVDGNVFVGTELIDRRGNLQHVFSENESCNISYSAGDKDPVTGEWWTFLPLAGFCNPNQENVAMTKWPAAWPSMWPDIADPSNPRYSPDGWRGSWNGYFGRDQFNADLESYFVADDYMNREWFFYPDSTDTLRRGLGMRLAVRGFQWQNALVNDQLFVLYDITNIGTTNYDKIQFAYKIGNDLGSTLTGNDGGDDSGGYLRDENVAYFYDEGDVGSGGWTPVGYFGAAFLESPGNSYDGIDNDNDGKDGSGVFITESMFNGKTLNVGDQIVVIDYTTFERTVEPMPNDTVRIPYQNLVYKFYPGKELSEIPFDLVDNNLNGVIDESNGVTFEGDSGQVTTYLNVGYKSVDYVNHIGEDNPLIDERRDDGEDNDGNWTAENDVGADGKAYTLDAGEGDGVPTPGEPHFDQTDIHETDMLGLTSFRIYLWSDIPLYDDETVWQENRPGLFNNSLTNQNTELFYGSGYFPMAAGQTQRFSIGFICGVDLVDFLDNNEWAATAYAENYNFARAPKVPTLRATAGDNCVTLVWDDAAEQPPYDPVTGDDFEGYRIYRSTDVGFNDMVDITDGKGNDTYIRPLVQFDVDNDFQEYASVPIKGVHFWLGTNTGLVHTYKDTTAKNGFTYYYAVTAYDHGSDSLGIAPTECNYKVVKNTDGTLVLTQNVVVVRPEAPVAGYVEAGCEAIQAKPGSTTNGYISVEVIFPDSVKDGHTYQVTFADTLNGTGRNLKPATQSFNLIDVTSGDTLMKNSADFTEGLELPETHGFRLAFHNVYEELALNSDSTLWSRTGIYPLAVGSYSYTKGELDLQVADYKIIFGEVGVGASTEFMRDKLLPSMPVNFTIWNATEKKEAKFAFREQDALVGEEGMFTAFTADRKTKKDEIIILTDSLVGGWQVSLNTSTTDTLQPQAGDTAFVVTNKPFLSNDVFEFTMKAEHTDDAQAKVDMDDIRVVPNPYVVSNSWEPANPYANGRGDRVLHFINLPAQCTIRIFNIRGQLVQTIEHDSGVKDAVDVVDATSAWDGTAVWNLQSKENLDIAYGIYVYHIDAGNLGTKIGKFAIIK